MRIEKVLRIIESNFHRALSIGEMAMVVNLSYSRLEHLFKAEMGITPTSYLKNIRIEKARELLETTFLTNQQIMTRVGLSDESHFARDFKKAYGLRPRQYRTQYHVENNQGKVEG
ncbi:MAG TPA: helix-turn-helix domain-containing protein [Pyrinomonadaceae bacterium]